MTKHRHHDKSAAQAPAQRDREHLAALFDGGRDAEAERVARVMSERFPDHPLAWKALARVRLRNARVAEAIRPLRKWVKTDPGDIDALVDLGNALKDIGERDAALEAFETALHMRPGFAEMHNNIGNVLREMHRPHESLAQYDAALALRPDYAEAHSNRGNALQNVGRIAEAEAAYREALQIRPDFTDGHSNLLFCLNFVGTGDSAAMLAEARRYGAAVSARARPKFGQWLCDPAPERLRVGFVSGDFGNHPVGHFLLPLLAHRDRAAIECYAFPARAIVDDTTKALAAGFDHWIPIHAMDDRTAATLIHRLGIDILIDLSGHTAANRLPMFALRPAPVQVSWLGYFATTGLPEIDYVLGDPALLPDGAAAEFTEKVWPLPHTWLCHAAPDDAPAVAPTPAATLGHVTFGNFGNLAKINDAVIALWARVLNAVPDARLMLKSWQFSNEAALGAVHARFAAHGIAADRIGAEGQSPRGAYLAAHGAIDIVLDTFPYPGGTTSVDALWMGVPVLTLQGDRFLGRLGCSIAQAAHHPHWIARDADDFVAKAATYAGDIPALAAARAARRDALRTTPLFDPQRFAADFVDTLRALWRDRLGG